MLKDKFHLEMLIRKKALVELLLHIKKTMLKGLKFQSELLQNMNNLSVNSFESILKEESTFELIEKDYKEICDYAIETKNEIDRIIDLENLGQNDMRTLIESIDGVNNSLSDLAKNFEERLNKYVLKIIVIKNLGQL